ncbi:MAG: hypothetical protein IRZ00_16620 [Gemmatimonadetes bacterium]|nr:hypothetical protein [Gemmatimonadota bacterium]
MPRTEALPSDARGRRSVAILRPLAGIALLAGLAAPRALAAQSAFLLVDGPATVAAQRSELRYDAAYGDRGFEALDGNALQQRVWGRWWVGSRLALVARASMTPAGGAQRFSEQAEAQLRATDFGGATPVLLAVGARREYGGDDVLLARVAGAHVGARSTLAADVTVERPLASGRDAVDLITGVGWSRRVSPSFSVSLEALGEDLEGFWEAEEAEGGATLFAGPSLALSPGAHRWSIVLGAGPVLRATRSPLDSGAPRELTSSRSAGYLVRTSFRLNFGR